MDEYIFTIYNSNQCAISYDGSYGSLKATENINAGTLMVVEHALSEETRICLMLIRYHGDFYDFYAPRDEDKMNSGIPSYSKAESKLSANCFGVGGDILALTKTITRINHSCDPNCGVNMKIYFDRDYDFETIFMELYALKDIIKGGELTISYGPATCHKRGFECCSRSKSDREKNFNLVKVLIAKFHDGARDQFKSMINSFIMTEAYHYAMINRFLISNCIVMRGGRVEAINRKGVAFIDSMVERVDAGELEFQEKISEDDALQSDSHIKCSDAASLHESENELILKLFFEQFRIRDKT